jgi:23S rRNA pseudouridine1911/1915/1917 synthase
MLYLLGILINLFYMQNLIHLQSYIPERLAGLRLDQALAQLFPEYSRARIQQWIQSGKVLVDGHTKRPRDKAVANQRVTLTVEITKDVSWEPQAIPLNIIYEDEEILIINKPPGLVVHPGAGNRDNTLVNALLHYAPELAHLPRAGIVHRLDKDTSGLLVVARTLTAHHDLIKQLQARKVKREYQAIVLGTLAAGGTLNKPIGRHPTQRTRMAVLASGKPAITHYRVLERFRAHTLLQISLETGRTHQIRVHLAYLHHPLAGDKTYGAQAKVPPHPTPELLTALHAFKRQALHAYGLGITHPCTKKALYWEIPLPNDMRLLLELLRQDTLTFRLNR